MGLEWHDRYRDRLGRFAVNPDPERKKKVQINLKIDEKTARGIRLHAPATLMEMGDYVAMVLRLYWTGANPARGRGRDADEPTTANQCGPAPLRGGAAGNEAPAHAEGPSPPTS